MANDFSVETVFRAIDRTTAPIKAMTRATRAFTRTAETGLRRVSRRYESINRSVHDLGRKAVATGAVAGASFLAMARTGAQFEQTMVNAAVKFPEGIQNGTAEFKELSGVAKTVGRTTEFSSSQAASGMEYLAMAGFNANQAMAALPATVDLATASQTDLATATDIASDTLGVFGLMTKDTTQLQKNLTRVNDVLAKTTTSANTNMIDMFEAIKDGAPVARSAGADIETVSTLIAGMAKAGIRGTRAGTALKNMMLAVSAPSKEGAKTLHALGVATVDSSGNVRDMLAVLKDFRAAIQGMGSAQQSKIFDSIFGRIPIASAINLVNQAGDSMEAYRRTLRHSGGAASAMAKQMRDTTLGSWKSLQSAIEGVSIRIFEMQEGPLKDAIDQMTKWTRANQDLIATKVGEWLLYIVTHFQQIVTWGKRIAIVVGLLWAANSVLKVLTATMTLLNVVMDANPISLIVIGIAAAIAAVTVLIMNFDKIKAWFDGLPRWADAALSTLLVLFAPVVGLPLLIARNWGAVKAAFKAVADFIKSVFNAELAAIERRINKIVSIAKAIGSAFGSAWSGITRAADWVTGSGGDNGGAQADGGQQAETQPQVIGPQERASIFESRRTETNRAELVIKDQTGRAEMLGKPGPWATMELDPTGGFN